MAVAKCQPERPKCRARSALKQELVPLQRTLARTMQKERRHLTNHRASLTCTASPSYSRHRRRCSNRQFAVVSSQATWLGRNHDPWDRASAKFARSRCLGRPSKSKAVKPRGCACCDCAKTAQRCAMTQKQRCNCGLQLKENAASCSCGSAAPKAWTCSVC